MATRGGRREGAGGKPAWKHGATKPIRIPIALADEVLRITRILDEGKFEDSDNLHAFAGLVTDSKVIDLTGIAVRATKDGPAVYLADLLRAGYTIKPDQVVKNLRREPSLSSLRKEVQEEIERLKRLENGALGAYE